MTNPARGIFTQAELNNANGELVTLEDAQEITNHDEPSEDQWCYVSCETLVEQDICENIYGCYWYNDGCHTDLPICEDLNNQVDCLKYGCYWYRNACYTIDQPEICYWIDSKGGPTGILITDIFEIIDSYLFSYPPPGYSFIPTLANVFGIIDYYLGFNGDSKTGCSYFG